jgi:hypothetical protein
MLMGATAMACGFVCFQAPLLLEEYQGLCRDWRSSAAVKPLGFINIAPDPNYATPPVPWAQVEGGELRLWGRWDASGGHQWFRLKEGSLDLATLMPPIGRDVVRAIVSPVRERPGGKIREELPDETPVIGLSVGRDEALAYPLLVLQKVEVVNDHLNGRPVLVVHTPFVPEEEATDVFDPRMDQTTLTFGLSGHFQNPGPRPLLYDHQTESLWTVRDHTLSCVAGEMAGIRLSSCGRPTPVSWDDWETLHPESLVLVGAMREGSKSARSP